jgi:predicted PurR-regulated permease PerM
METIVSSAPKWTGDGLRILEDRAFVLLTVAISLIFAWVLWPFFGAVLWATILTIVFEPVYRRLAKSMGERRNLAAIATVVLVVAIVILPATLITASLVRQASGLYQMFRSGELNLANNFHQVLDALPPWLTSLLDSFGLTDLATAQQKLADMLMRGSQVIASQAINIGQTTFEVIVRLFIMLYLLFFLLRDGDELFRSIKDAVPLTAEHQRAVFSKFATVIRATVKGTVVIAIMQGALGGLIFWFLGIRAALLWAVLMAFLSLLPAVGAALVWAPVAIYFLVTGAVWEGVVLIAFGTLVIGLVDNLVRPILVGADTKMPDYVVLISTLGGLEVFGMNGIVLGPVIAAMFIVVWDIFAAEHRGKPTSLDKAG